MYEGFCVYPWNSLYVQPDGSVRICCISRYTLGNIKTDNIEDILNNEQIKKTKERLAA